MRIATYNIEWFNALFDDDGVLVRDGSWSKRFNVTKQMQADAIATVLRAMDADAIMVIEAPDTSRTRDTVYALEGFAAHYGLRQRAAAVGFANDTQQEIALLYDPDMMQVDHRPGDAPDAPQFDQTLALDLDVDAKMDAVVWSKPPFECWVTPRVGDPFMLIGVHAKSKAAHGATSDADAMRINIANRRKQLAQCIWLRRRVERLLADKTPTIVLGDFNDGPGLDDYEKLFGRSGVEVVMGEGANLCLYDPHAHMALTNRFANPTTARFWISSQNRFLSALLDYIMVSPDLRPGARWRIWHPFEDAAVFKNQPLKDALLTASDHFPVTLEWTASPQG